jgi:predicted nucleotidyltransferase
MKKFSEWNKAAKQGRILLTRCREHIQKIDPHATVILYGSRARGDCDPESDYDLLVLIDKPVTLEQEDLIRRQLFPVEIETGYVFTVSVYSYQQWASSLYRAMPFHRNVEKYGVIL